MTNKEAIQQYLDINIVQQSNYIGLTFNIALTRSKKSLYNIIGSILEAVEPLKDFIKYNEERESKLRKLGSLSLDKKSYDLDDNQEEFDEWLEELKVKHKKAITNRDKQLDDYNDLLPKEVELGENETITLFKINTQDLPKNITSYDIDLIAELINFEAKEVEMKVTKRKPKRS